MESVILLKPEEIYFLGSLLDAKYLDYAYMAAMDDIGTNMVMFRKKVQDSLVKKGFLLEDFSGNLEVKRELKELLEPVYNGEFETECSLLQKGEDKTAQIIKFHFLNGKITKVTLEDNMLTLKSVTEQDIDSIITSLLPQNYDNLELKDGENFDKDKAEGIISIKTCLVGKSSSVDLFALCNDVVYREDDKGQVVPVTASEFRSKVHSRLSGGDK